MDRNKIRIIKEEILSENRYVLKNVHFHYLRINGEWQLQSREIYQTRNGAAILLYNKEHNKVLLVQQFRMPTCLNGNATGMLIEVCAGLLEGDNTDACIKREVREETGYSITTVEKVYEAYMSPGATTESLHFYIGEYTYEMKSETGGGKEEEQEDIELMEIHFSDALKMIKDGSIKDAKTIMLLQYAQINRLLV